MIQDKGQLVNQGTLSLFWKYSSVQTKFLQSKLTRDVKLTLWTSNLYKCHLPLLSKMHQTIKYMSIRLSFKIIGAQIFYITSLPRTFQNISVIDLFNICRDKEQRANN